jgi:hypothetical protein
VIVEGSIASVKVAVKVVLIATPVAALTGIVELTMGAVVSGAMFVVVPTGIGGLSRGAPLPGTPQKRPGIPASSSNPQPVVETSSSNDVSKIVIVLRVFKLLETIVILYSSACLC